MQLSIDGEGHLSYAQLTDEQVKFLRELSDDHLDGFATLATAARGAIEQSRQARQGQKDGPGNGT